MNYKTVDDGLLEKAWLILRKCYGDMLECTVDCSRNEAVASLVEHMEVTKTFAHDIIHQGRYKFWHIKLNENHDERVYIHSKKLHIY